MKPIKMAPGLALPLDAVTRTFGIFGQRETGKSTTAAVLVEGAVREGGRAVVLDPTGVWYGLTRAGTQPGLPGVVLGGEFADAPLEPTAGRVVAEFVIGTDYPLVVLDLKLMRKHQRQHFAMEFLEVLYHDNRDPLLVVMDEAAQFAPQQMREGGDVPRLLGAVEDLVKLGRSRGLGAAMIEQRIATLNANVREQIGTLFAHRLIGPLDRKALKQWIDAQGEPEREAEAIAAIAKLEPGRALVWSPAWIKFFGIVDMNNATTFDSRATPEVGKARKRPGQRAAVDLDTLRDQMADTIERAKENDPAALRKRAAGAEAKLAASLRDIAARPTHEQVEDMRRDIVSLRAQLESRPAATVEVPVILDTEPLDRLAALATEITDSFAALGELADGIRTTLIEASSPFVDAVALLQQTPAPAHSLIEKRGGHQPRSAGPPPTAPPPKPQDVRPDENGHARVTGPQQRILDALAWFEAVGVPSPRRPPLAGIAGVRATSGGFRANVSSLSGAGLIQYPDPGRVSLTDVGRALAMVPDIAPTEEALHDAVLATVSRPQADLLRSLIAVYPEQIDRDSLAQAVGVQPTSGGFRANVSTLSGLELVEYPDRGHVRAAPLLFVR